MYQKLLKKDKVMSRLIRSHGEKQITKRKNAWLHLCTSILSQQLSTTVASVIRDRFLALYGNRFPTPEQVLQTPVETFRSIGFSYAKANYVHNVARFAMEQGMDDSKLARMGDEEVIEYLLRIKGVGRWTVEMLLIFTLGREDVFAVDDLGIQQSMAKLFKLDTGDKKKFKADMLRLAEAWRPYRSYACLHLWAAKDGE